jgi:hypothetical protein
MELRFVLKVRSDGVMEVTDFLVDLMRKNNIKV